MAEIGKMLNTTAGYINATTWEKSPLGIHVLSKTGHKVIGKR